MLTIFIHGATASGASFNYLRSDLDGEHLVLEYDSEDGFFYNLDQLSKQIEAARSRELFFIGHSLGGIYSLSLADRFPKQTRGGITISTPYGGSEIAPFLKYFVPFNRLLKEIGPNSKPIQHVKNITPLVPWHNIVTVKGNSPWIAAANDGVVTVDSQRHHECIEYIEMSSNHYEVLMSPEVVNLVKQKRSQALRKK
jgi:pimeloyl-ACP methyl ester carboxylesterase